MLGKAARAYRRIRVRSAPNFDYLTRVGCLPTPSFFARFLCPFQVMSALRPRQPNAVFPLEHLSAASGTSYAVSLLAGSASTQYSPHDSSPSGQFHTGYTPPAPASSSSGPSTSLSHDYGHPDRS